MSAPLHLVIPGPTPFFPGPTESVRQPPPKLSALLRALQPTQRITCADDCPAMPYELALARLNNMPDTPGMTPWAAFETQTVGEPCAWLHLCHWQVGMNSVILTDPAALALGDAESRQLLATLAPYFADDGITLRYAQPGTWLAVGEVFRDLRCVSLARVVGQAVGDWQALGGTPAESTLRRLQNEIQMLLYTLPANDEREARGLLPVNSFWVTGAGVLDRQIAPAAGVEVDPRLLAAGADPAALAKAWAEVDADACQRLLNHLRNSPGVPCSLTLCGERAAQTFELIPQGFFQKIKAKFGRSGIPDMLSTL